MNDNAQLKNLLAKNAILKQEMNINNSVANNEIDSLTTQLADAVEIIYNNDMEVIENV